MVTFGIDISHHQGGSLNFVALRKAGIDFAFLKSTEGSGFVDSQFENNLTRARAAGLLVAAYHYVRSGISAADQVANVVRVVPKDVPVIPDVEANSGGIALVREFVKRLEEAGYEVPFAYIPKWYWQQIGSPSLKGLPLLWSSRYPDNKVQDFKKEYEDAPASYWSGYGDQKVAILQYTSSANVAGVQPLDANAFLGTREELAAALGGESEEDMSMYDSVTFKLADGTEVKKTHSEIIAELYKAHLITELAPARPGGEEGPQTVHDAIWTNFNGIKTVQKLVSDLQVGMESAIREALVTVLTEHPPTVGTDVEATARAVVAELKKEGN